MEPRNFFINSVHVFINLLCNKINSRGVNNMSTVVKYTGNSETLELNSQYTNFIIEDILQNLPKDKRKIPSNFITSTSKHYEIAVIYVSNPQIQESIDAVFREYEILSEQVDVIAINYKPYAETEEAFKNMSYDDFMKDVENFKNALNSTIKIFDINDYIRYENSHAFIFSNPLNWCWSTTQRKEPYGENIM